MPTRHGIQEMRILIRSASLWEPDGQLTLRPTSRVLFRDLRGPGVGVVQEFTPESRFWGLDLRNSTGNIESVPPYAGGGTGTHGGESMPTFMGTPSPRRGRWCGRCAPLWRGGS
ncbi:hypothetical protein ACFQ1S_46280 [Kibdelosporangium lantanae]|uniref:Uncharacterized protein n=1 Tax=Kibdelosporangium lantanae TaxID=1497396 RepID=A0ABW3MTD2_9PSEU